MLGTLRLSTADATACRVEGHVGHKRQVPGPEYRGAQWTLVLGTHARPAARLNLGPVRNIPAQLVHVLVVYILYVVDAE